MTIDLNAAKAAIAAYSIIRDALAAAQPALRNLANGTKVYAVDKAALPVIDAAARHLAISLVAADWEAILAAGVEPMSVVPAFEDGLASAWAAGLVKRVSNMGDEQAAVELHNAAMEIAGL